ncbi:DUF805 domain-containing protein [Mesorhizobium australicum]|uniref:DUF805 domain-containing protein n=1 Tax=Mesorhizobium australicum TaxID=536018 RepID=UPI003336B103
MSLTATDEWFSTSVRRNRKSFFLASILLIVLMLVVIAALAFFTRGSLRGQWIFFLFLVPFVICTYFLAAQRLRDMNVTGWLALLWIPAGIADTYVGGAASLAFLIVLCVVPGTQGDNRYGPDPLQR